MPRAPGSNQNTANALGFLLTLVGPAILAGSAILGRATGRQDLFAFLPLIVAFGVVPSLSVCGLNGAEPPPVEPASPATWLFYRLLPVSAVPGQIASLAVAVDYWTDHSLDITGRIGWLLSTGVFSALFAITLAHELIHHLSRVDRALGGILLSTACFGTFKIVHLRVHHRYVGTDRDFGSARQGDSISGCAA
jgi:alkane 1-monooxygenase